MEARQIVEMLLAADGPIGIRTLFDASVHLPPRGSLWVAAYRDDTGRPIWRTTRLRRRGAALALAKEWENEAKRKRAAQGALPRRPSIRVRPRSGERDLGLLTPREVATILRISERAVREIERRAFDKIRQHPAMREFWREHETGEVKEATAPTDSAWMLSRAEIDAVYALARTPTEQQVLRKLLALTQRHA